MKKSQIDLAVRGAEIAKENKAVIFGIGHLILAGLETDDADIIEDYFVPQVIENGYLKEYIRFIYSSDNCSPGNRKMTVFVERFLSAIENEIDAGGAFMSRTLKRLVNNDDFTMFAENFSLWVDANEFNIEQPFNGIQHKVEAKFKDIKYLINLNQKVAKENPVIIGRDEELYELTEILLKKTKANACLVGDAGVGKTAVVEKLAQQINLGNVPDALANKVIMEINVSALVGGTKYRGEFEEKLNKLLQKVENEPDVILFIDEIHMVMGLGGSEGAVDASNILKPALARGRIRIIGSTTYEEYRKYISKDKAFERRFEKVDVNEPTVEETKGILAGVKKQFEDFHKVSIEASSIKELLTLSQKYMANRKFPDKAIDILDTACVAVSLAGRKKVTPDDIVSTIEKKTHVKINKQVDASLEKTFKKVLKGQDEALKEVANQLKIIDMGLVDTSKPLATMLFTGPTGTGKTELAKQIAKTYFGSDAKLVRLDMSEYSNESDVTKLIGSAPGYVGYDESSPLLEGVKKQPYSVVLLDEVEKSNSKVLNTLLQMLDEGFLTSSTGEKVDFRNTIVIMTSNLGFHNTDSRPIAFGSTSNVVKKQVDSAIDEKFSPEFLNRIDKVVYFNRLNKDVIREISENYVRNFGKYSLSDEDIDRIMELADVDKQGARAIQRVIRTKILPNKVQEANTII